MRLVTALLIVLVAILSSGMAESVFAQTSEQLGTGDGLNCENFRSVAEGGGTDLDLFFAEVSNDPYDLDRGDSPIPCEDRTELGTGALANCLSFRPASEGGQQHAQALFDAAGPGDPYGLDANGDERACFVEAAQEAPPSAPAPSAPTTAGCAIVAEVAHASACAGGPVSLIPDPDDEDVLPVATSNDIFTSGLLSSLTQRTAEQGSGTQESRTVEAEHRAERKAEKRKDSKAKRLKQRRLERQRPDQQRQR